MTIYPVIMRNPYTQFKYIVGTQYVLYGTILDKSSSSNLALEEIWKEGIRIKINETV